MDFTTDQTHDDIRNAVRTLCGKFGDDYWMAHDNSHEFPWEFYNAIAEGGWLGLTVPEEYGGGGLGVTEAAIIEREISASGAGMGGCSAVHIGIFGFEPIIHHGSEQMKRKYLPRVVTGELHTSFAVTEPDAGTDTTNIKTFARKVDGGWVVSGKKVWITKAQEAEKMLLLCRTSPRDETAKRTAGMTLLFADVDRDHVQIREIPKMGRNAVDTNELFIDELFVADEDVVGEVGNGFRTILGGLNAERVISANAALGIGEAALRRGVQYAKEREVFGRPIGQNQGIAFQLAEARIRLDAAAAVLDKATWMVDQGMDCGREANAAKYLCAEAGFYSADVALQVHGGNGFALEYPVSRILADARILNIFEGAGEIQAHIIARRLLEGAN